MYFQVRKEWEVDSLVYAAFGGLEERRFPQVELSHNFIMFHVDFTYEDEDGYAVGRRLLCASISDTLRCINHDKVRESTISLFLRRCDNDGNYAISDVIEIIEAKDEYDQLSHIYCCKDGRRYVDSLIASSEEGLKELKRIYYQST